MNLCINLHLFLHTSFVGRIIVKYLITQKGFILVRKARPPAESVGGLGPRLAPNRWPGSTVGSEHLHLYNRKGKRKESENPVLLRDVDARFIDLAEMR